MQELRGMLAKEVVIPNGLKINKDIQYFACLVRLAWACKPTGGHLLFIQGLTVAENGHSLPRL